MLLNVEFNLIYLTLRNRRYCIVLLSHVIVYASWQSPKLVRLTGTRGRDGVGNFLRSIESQKCIKSERNTYSQQNNIKVNILIILRSPYLINRVLRSLESYKRDMKDWEIFTSLSNPEACIRVKWSKKIAYYSFQELKFLPVITYTSFFSAHLILPNRITWKGLSRAVEKWAEKKAFKLR